MTTPSPDSAVAGSPHSATPPTSRTAGRARAQGSILERSIAWCDDQLARVSMHRLTAVVLAVLAAIAIAVAAVGELPYEPTAMLITLAVCVAVSVAVTWLGALLVRRNPVPESAVITGLLLFFLLWPSTDPQRLAWYAVGAAVAAASKYVLVFRGSHLINPAALGVAALAVSGKAPVIWWVGSAVLFVPVLIAALLIARRTATMRYASGVWIAATVVTAVTLLGDGMGAVEAWRTALLSYPWLFWAAFMVTEPMTAPQRTGHRWLVGAGLIAAIAFPIHWSAGPLTVVTSPELALIAANILTALLVRPRAQWATVTGHSLSPAGVLSVTFAPRRPVRVEAGQWVELQFARGGWDARGARRVFSPIAGRLLEDEGSHASGSEFTIVTRMPESPSLFKRQLASSAIGTRVRVTRVGGSFLLPLDPDVPLLLVAGGIGITPVLAFLKSLGPECGGRDVTVVYQVGSAGTVVGEDLLADSGARVVLVSPSAAHTDPLTALAREPSSWSVVEADRISRGLIAEHVGDVVWRAAYVSGPPAMVRATAHELRGARALSVHRDVFFGA